MVARSDQPTGSDNHSAGRAGEVGAAAPKSHVNPFGSQTAAQIHDSVAKMTATNPGAMTPFAGRGDIKLTGSETKVAALTKPGEQAKPPGGKDIKRDSEDYAAADKLNYDAKVARVLPGTGMMNDMAKELANGDAKDMDAVGKYLKQLNPNEWTVNRDAKNQVTGFDYRAPGNTGEKPDLSISFTDDKIRVQRNNQNPATIEQPRYQ